MRAKVLECPSKLIFLNIDHCEYEFWPYFVIDVISKIVTLIISMIVLRICLVTPFCS